MRVTVAGTGYVGLVTAVCLASKNHVVTCVDVDENKINMLKNMKSPIFEDNLENMLCQYNDRLQFTNDYKKAYANAEVIIIGVGTPEKLDGSANLEYVYNVVEQISESVVEDTIVVIKSTVPIGTNDKIDKYFRKNQNNDINIEVVSNPEFLSQGTAIKDTLYAERIVIGVESKNAEIKMRELYQEFNSPILVTNRKSAEMIKYASNDFLALKISFINEIANLCELVGANIEDVSKGMGYDSRIGDKFLKAGIGYGGSCFPKDTKALHWLSNYYDYELKTVKATIEVNEQQKIKLIKKSRKYYDSLRDKTVAILGLAFKPNTDDLREAPSLVNVQMLLEEGANIKAWDPVAIDNFKKVYPNGIVYCSSIEETILDADICFIFTEWKEIREMDIKLFKKLMKNPIVLDGRNCFDLNAFTNTNIIYDSIGRA